MVRNKDSEKRLKRGKDLQAGVWGRSLNDRIISPSVLSIGKKEKLILR